MPRGTAFTMQQAKQIDFLMMYARRELNVTGMSGAGSKGYHKLEGPGGRFTYTVECFKCDVGLSDLSGAKYAIRFVLEHLGHKTEVSKPEPRVLTQTETGDASRYSRRKAREWVDGLPSERMRALSNEE